MKLFIVSVQDQKMLQVTVIMHNYSANYWIWSALLHLNLPRNGVEVLLSFLLVIVEIVVVLIRTNLPIIYVSFWEN